MLTFKSVINYNNYTEEEMMDIRIKNQAETLIAKYNKVSSEQKELVKIKNLQKEFDFFEKLDLSDNDEENHN